MTMSGPNHSSLVETVVGAAVVALAVGFFAFAYRTAGMGSSISGGYRVSAEFDNAEGINVGTDVRLAGVKVGTVTEQHLNPENYMAHIEMALDSKVQLSDDTAAKVTSEGLLGSKFISLDPGGSDTKLADGGVISMTQGSIDMWAMISKAMFEKSPAPAPAAPAQGDGTAQ
jgi:phospholipid/cholesterol/gamma-HCH transport system substrate-binding protein